MANYEYQHNAQIVSGSDIRPLLKEIGQDVNVSSRTERETTGGEAYDHLCFETAQMISPEQEDAILSLPNVYDCRLNVL